ncbi:hypothetical protein EHQ53_06355 [Leptospira langatensis]|uniref:Uncharacterized protein n=1 Tax=Leptospira langatensis TaxID=2484983 RepID=A0A5F1ZTF7_9LEPT|nr:hypothetical protein [Leptospira langatensis]TGK03073.1 hypothetical protein EHO57_07190 [Leptospira langatensis]TGL41829.1 hypothetical protein EHQ53_06355 [Leptospira langatensis]
MNQITQFFSNLKADFDRLNQSVDDLVRTYNAIVQFLDLISNLFPVDLVLVLLLSIPLLYIINTLSPSSPRINYTIAVVFVSGLRSFLSHAIYETWNLFAVSKTAILLLLPAYFLVLLKLLVSWGRRYRIRQKALSPRNLESSFENLQKTYRTLSAEIYSNLSKSETKGFVDGERLLPSIKELEESIAGLKTLIQKPETQSGDLQ